MSVIPPVQPVALNATSPRPRPPMEERQKRIIAVASGKGGVGKTWCSVSLSHALSKLGQRVLLFDGDLGLANVDIQLGLMCEHDLGNVINGELSMRQARSPYMDGGFDILAGRSGSATFANMPASRFISMRAELALLTQDYDRIILDLGAGVERSVRAFTSIAQNILVVISTEPTSLTDAYAYIKLVAARSPLPNIRVIVNMADTREDGQKAYETLAKACKSFLRIEPSLLGIVRRDKMVNNAIRNQKPILTYAENSQAADDIRSMANMLL